MKLRRFGSSDLMVSEIGFGGSRLGGLLASGTIDSGVATLHAACDAGINFYDTADMYSQGEGEALLGRAFNGRRNRVVIASKGGYVLPARRRLLAQVKPLLRPVVQFLGIKRKHLPVGASGALTQNFSPAYLTRAVEASLQRLRTDYLDVYQLHSPPSAVFESNILLDALETLESMQRAGKVRYIGVAADTLDDAEGCASRRAFHTLQVPVGLVDPDTRALMPAWQERGIGVIARGAFGGGILKESLTETELRALTPKCDWILELRQLAKQGGRSVLELALQFSLRDASVGVTLLGMHTVDHVRKNVRYCDAAPLSDDEYAACVQLAARLAGPSAPV
ncbi:MAG: aldo/keto reductase [Gemmatimonadaceae bacterium]|nr:aldo/keto reductase [Gemmatimonadaceae bacterium]